MSVLLKIAAALCFLIGAMLAFGWFGVAANYAKAIGWDGIGLAALTLSLLVPDGWSLHRGPPG